MPALHLGAEDSLERRSAMKPTEDILDNLIRYGFQAAGAIVIPAVGAIAGRWISGLTGRGLEKKAIESPRRRGRSSSTCTNHNQQYRIRWVS